MAGDPKSRKKTKIRMTKLVETSERKVCETTEIALPTSPSMSDVTFSSLAMGIRVRVEDSLDSWFERLIGSLSSI